MGCRLLCVCFSSLCGSATVTSEGHTRGISGQLREGKWHGMLCA